MYRCIASPRPILSLSYDKLPVFSRFQDVCLNNKIMLGLLAFPVALFATILSLPYYKIL